MIVLFQNPISLLRILSFPILKLNDVIKMTWINPKKPITKDLKTNLIIWKQWVLNALTYLIIHNLLYKNVVLNHEMLNEWFSIFISSKLQDNIIYINDDYYDECQKYSHNFQNMNLKNGLQKTIMNIITNLNTKLMTSSFITFIKKEKRQPEMQVLNAITIILVQKQIETGKNNETKITQKNGIEKNSKYVIFYKSTTQLSLISHWFDVLYFLTAFSSVLFQESRRHVDKRECAISIKNFVSWHCCIIIASCKLLFDFLLLLIVFANLHFTIFSYFSCMMWLKYDNLHLKTFYYQKKKNSFDAQQNIKKLTTNDLPTTIE